MLIYNAGTPVPYYCTVYKIPLSMRILPQVLHMSKNREKKITFIHSNASLQCFSFLSSGKCDMNLSILDSILKFLEKSKKIHVLGIDVYRSGSTFLDAYPDQDPAK